MASISITSRVGPDGVLKLDLPIGVDQANRQVRVTVESLRPGAPMMTPQQWQDFLRRTAGSMDDPAFRRHEQGQLQDRDEMFP